MPMLRYSPADMRAATKDIMLPAVCHPYMLTPWVAGIEAVLALEVIDVASIHEVHGLDEKIGLPTLP